MTNTHKNILVVDDEFEMRLALKEALNSEGYNVKTADNGFDAIEKFSSEKFDVVITDIKMPKMSGVDLLKEVKKRSLGTPVLVITAYGTVDSAVTAMKEGAYDYILKPFPLELIENVVKRALNASKPTNDKKNLNLHLNLNNGSQEREIITDSENMKKLLNITKNIAKSDATVLVQGESGTGKELFARFIHNNSTRRNKPFVAVNCASLPEGLLESELFGHEKGAFTGAISRKPGKFELANNGTILLDEITEMPALLQAKLLRVLQEHEIDPVGSKEPIHLNIRVIATTNRNLRETIRNGAFREDLFYRLNVVPIIVPPLRMRSNDAIILSKYFLKKHCKKNNKQILDFSDEALEFISKAKWRGNVRELENIIERTVLLCDGNKIEIEHMFLDGGVILSDKEQGVKSESEKTDPSISNMTVKEMEKRLIFNTMKEVLGNRTKAADMLGISIRTLRNKLNEYKQESLVNS